MFASLGHVNLLPMNRERSCCTACSSDRLLAEHNPALGRLDGEGTKIEQFVMKRTKAESIRLDVGATCRVPLDVCAFKPCWHVADSQIEAADTTAVFISHQDFLSECRVASPHLLAGIWLARLGCEARVRQGEPGFRNDVIVQRLRKVSVQ